MERWAPVRGYEALYEVSDLGRVRSSRIVLRASPAGDGYLKVDLYRRAERTTVAIHRLVATAFCEGEAPSLEVCHRDGNRTNNRASNLRWDTSSANSLDTVAHGTHHETRKTHCAQGHLLDGNNTGRSNGQRFCRTCKRARTTAWRARQAA